jgi:DNA-3-methyladenine glycosylase I
MTNVKRCAWCESSDMMRHYHDTEWGVPLHDDNRLFEFIVLDSFQAGLSWSTILKRRESFRSAFDGFDPVKVAAYNEDKIQALLKDPGIIRNRLKVYATVGNARAFLDVQKEFGSFDRYIWGFVGHKPVRNGWMSAKEIPPRTELSDAMSRDMIKRGFKFAGSTICYAFMQAAGLINDHTTDCFRYQELTKFLK